MLFVESKTLNFKVDGPARIRVLEGLREKNLVPVIRSARLNIFEHVLLEPDRIAELETAAASATESEPQESYVRGDLFCLGDHVFFLVFDDHGDKGQVVRAGLVYEARTSEPFRKLDSFCWELRELILSYGEPNRGEAEIADASPQWQQGKPIVPEGFRRFIAKQDSDSLYTSLRKETMTDRIRAATILEDAGARIFLRRAKEAHVEGYAAKLLVGDTMSSYASSIDRLADAGLVGREVQVSCRKTGHALFKLPTAHALAVVTVSDATCSECGSPVADEKVEEVVAPTQLASSLLEDGSWLVSRLHHLLREQGVPEREIAVGPSTGEGYGQMMANICGEPFLLLARDGDLTPAFARWAIDLELETEAAHLVIVATGRIHNQAGVLLHNHARHRVRAGRDFEMVLADDVETAAKELRSAFERVSHRIVAEQLCDLDSSIGLNLSSLIVTKFTMLKKADAAESQDLAGESSSEFFYAHHPLTLAAGASANAGAAPPIDDPARPETHDSFGPVELESTDIPNRDEEEARRHAS